MKMKTVRMKSIEEIRLPKLKHLEGNLQSFRKMTIKEIPFGRRKMTLIKPRLINKRSRMTMMTSTGSRDLLNSSSSKTTSK